MQKKNDVSPKILIGIVVYNGVKHNRQVLERVARQPCKNIGRDVVDGGSTNGTLNVLDEYSKHISVRDSEPDKDEVGNIESARLATELRRIEFAIQYQQIVIGTAGVQQ